MLAEVQVVERLTQSIESGTEVAVVLVGFGGKVAQISGTQCVTAEVGGGLQDIVRSQTGYPAVGQHLRGSVPVRRSNSVRTRSIGRAERR